MHFWQAVGNTLQCNIWYSSALILTIQTTELTIQTTIDNSGRSHHQTAQQVLIVGCRRQFAHAMYQRHHAVTSCPEIGSCAMLEWSVNHVVTNFTNWKNKSNGR